MRNCVSYLLEQVCCCLSLLGTAPKKGTGLFLKNRPHNSCQQRNATKRLLHRIQCKNYQNIKFCCWRKTGEIVYLSLSSEMFSILPVFSHRIHATRAFIYRNHPKQVSYWLVSLMVGCLSWLLIVDCQLLLVAVGCWFCCYWLLLAVGCCCWLSVVGKALFHNCPTFYDCC